MSFVSKEIGDYTYAMRPLAPEKVLSHGYALLANVVAPGLRDIGASASLEVTSLMPVIIGAVLSRINSTHVQDAIKDVMKTATVVHSDGREVELEQTWKTHFIGKPGDLAAFVAWSLVEQFKDFFGGTAGQLRELGGMVASGIASSK